MCYALEIDLLSGQACRLYLEWDYFHEYDTSPERRALSSEEKRQQRERDKEVFLSEYYAEYDWGPYRWSDPEHEVRDLLWLIGQIDMIDERKPPRNNDALESVLKHAVSEGWIIPEIDQEYQGGMYAAPAGPLTARPNDDRILASPESFELNRSATLRSGEPILRGPYDPATQEAKLNAARSMSDATPLGEAQPLDYRQEMPDSDSFEIAKTPNEGNPGTWYSNPGSGQMRLYGDDGKPVVDFDFDHDHGQGTPHAHNWDGGARGPGLPFSLWP
jgi:hypothetical protein